MQLIATSAYILPALQGGGSLFWTRDHHAHGYKSCGQLNAKNAPICTSREKCIYDYGLAGDCVDTERGCTLVDCGQTDAPGPLLETIQADTFDECVTLCLITDRCKTLVYTQDNKACVLKAKDTNPTTSPTFWDEPVYIDSDYTAPAPVPAPAPTPGLDYMGVPFPFPVPVLPKPEPEPIFSDPSMDGVPQDMGCMVPGTKTFVTDQHACLDTCSSTKGCFQAEFLALEPRPNDDITGYEGFGRCRLEALPVLDDNGLYTCQP